MKRLIEEWEIWEEEEEVIKPEEGVKKIVPKYFLKYLERRGVLEQL